MIFIYHMYCHLSLITMYFCFNYINKFDTFLNNFLVSQHIFEQWSDLLCFSKLKRQAYWSMVWQVALLYVKKIGMLILNCQSKLDRPYMQPMQSGPWELLVKSQLLKLLVQSPPFISFTISTIETISAISTQF